MMRTAWCPRSWKLAQFSQNDRVAEMNVRAGRIDPELHAQRPAEGQLLAQLMLADNLGRAPAERRKSFIRLHDPKRNTAPERLALFVFVQ